MTKNQILVIFFSLINLIVLHSQLFSPSFVIEQEVWAIFSWVLILAKLISTYMILMTLSKESAGKIILLVCFMNFASYLFSLFPSMLIDTLISLIYNKDGAYFIGWFIFSVIFKTGVEGWIASNYLPQVDSKTMYLWMAIINTMITTISALGYVFTYYIKIV